MPQPVHHGLENLEPDEHGYVLPDNPSHPIHLRCPDHSTLNARLGQARDAYWQAVDQVADDAAKLLWLDELTALEASYASKSVSQDRAVRAAVGRLRQYAASLVNAVRQRAEPCGSFPVGVVFATYPCIPRHVSPEELTQFAEQVAIELQHALDAAGIWIFVDVTSQISGRGLQRLLMSTREVPTLDR